MALTRYPIGDLIELVEEINSENIYSVNDVRGMTITKEIIPTKANIEDTDLSRFIVVRPREFVFNPRTHGKHIGFGFNDTEETFIISWNNIAFRVKERMLKTVLPEYLFIHFNRNEWDREACYRSWGSSTEVFSWDALCDMMLDLPSVETQRKYVDIYYSLVKNQKSYERGLENLELAFEILLERQKHSAFARPLGQVFQEVNKQNDDGAVSNVQGINIDKQFMPSVANMTNVDLKKYKVVKKGQFAYSGMQTGRDECIRIALYTGDDPVIISPAYSVMQAVDDEVLPEYIMMWFLRKESDRRGWFMSDASIRTNLDLSRFYEIEIPVPPLPEQKAIVEIYNAYIARREINSILKARLKDICPVLIKGSLEDSGHK